MSTKYERRTYTRSQQVQDAQEALQQHLAARPQPYSSAWLAQLDAAASQLADRPEFAYDLAADPMYRQYRDQYMALGRQAMADTQGMAAALTGGYGSSYGITAGQQAYNGYLQELNAMIPELYQLAMDAYDRQGQRLYDRYNVLADREGLDYSRYQDGLAQWQEERGYLTDRADTQQQLDYTQFRDDVSDDQWQAAFDEDIRRFDFENKLGEFAAMGGGGGWYGYYGGRSGGKEDQVQKARDETKEKLPKISVAHRTNRYLRDESY